MIILHDKLTEYGGAEVVLGSMVKTLHPQKIVTSCVNKNIDWYGIYGVPIETPFLLSFSVSQKIYRTLYPCIALVCSFHNVKTRSTCIVYSSSAAKFFNIESPKVIFYSNYPAKPLLKYVDYLNKNLFGRLKLRMFEVFKPIWVYVESRALNKFRNKSVISFVTKNAYVSLYGDEFSKAKIVHCPVGDSLHEYVAQCDRPESPFPNVSTNIKVCIISRIYPEKDLTETLQVLNKVPNMSVFVIGDGPLLNEYRSLFANIVFLGFLDEFTKFSYVENSDFVVVPTSQEWSLVTVESNVLGVPVIAKASDSIKEINATITNEYAVNRVFKIADDLLEINTDEFLMAKEILKKNKEKIINYYSSTQFVKRLLG